MGEQQLLRSVEPILDIHPLHTLKVLFDQLNADDRMPFPLLVYQRHIQRNSESDGSFRALSDATITIPAGFRIRNYRKIAPGGVKVDIFGADVNALATLFTFRLIYCRGHMIAPNLLLLSTR